MSEQRRSPDLWGTRFADHVPLLLTSSIFAMFLTKVAAVAHGDTTTALAILERSSPSSVLLGLGLLVGMWFVLGIIGALLVATVRQARQTRSRTMAQVAVLGYSTLIGLIASAAGAAIVVLALTAWLWAPHRRKRQAAEPPSQSKTYTVGAACVFAIALTATDALWLPQEVLTLRGGGQVSGFVLDEDDSSIVVLYDRSRTVERLPTNTVSARHYCSKAERPWWQLPLTALRESDRPDYRRCPG